LFPPLQEALFELLTHCGDMVKRFTAVAWCAHCNRCRDVHAVEAVGVQRAAGCRNIGAGREATGHGITIQVSCAQLEWDPSYVLHLSLLLCSVIVQKPRFKMLLTDFAKICRGEMTLDALGSYAM
jgi:hypothetical protein